MPVPKLTSLSYVTVVSYITVVNIVFYKRAVSSISDSRKQASMHEGEISWKVFTVLFPVFIKKADM